MPLLVHSTHSKMGNVRPLPCYQLRTHFQLLLLESAQPAPHGVTRSRVQQQLARETAGPVVVLVQ